MLNSKNQKLYDTLGETYVNYGTNVSNDKLIQNDEVDSLLDPSKQKLWKNVIFYNLSFMLCCLGPMPIAYLQSSLNSDDGLGVISMAVQMGCSMIGCLLAGLLLQKFGHIRITGISYSMGFLFMLVNMYPTWYTLIPASIVGGTIAGSLVVAQRSYLASIAHKYARTFKTDVDQVQSRMFICNILMLKLSMVIGSLVSSLTLNTSDSNTNSTNSIFETCGAAYCNEDLQTDFKSNSLWNNGTTGNAPSAKQLYIFIGFGCGAILLGIIILAFFVSSLKNLNIDIIEKNKEPILKVLLSSIMELRDIKVLLLIPSALALSALDTMWSADFTKAFVTCDIGIGSIGFVTMWVGISGAISSVVFGWYNTKKYRIFALIAAPFIQIAIIIYLLLWKTGENSLIEFSVLTAIWYIGSGIRISLTPALIAVIFQDKLDSVFSNFTMWSFLAGTLFLIWSNLFCMYTKLYICLALLIASLIGYIALETFLYRKTSRKSEF